MGNIFLFKSHPYVTASFKFVRKYSLFGFSLFAFSFLRNVGPLCTVGVISGVLHRMRAMHNILT